MNPITQKWRQTVDEIPKNIKMIFIAILLNNIGMGMFSTLYNLYLQEIGFNKAFMGEMISMSALASAIFLVPVGFLSDRIGRKKTMMIGIFFAAFSQMLRVLVLDSTQLLTFSFLLGTFNSFFMVSNAPFLMENTTKKNRMRVFSINFALMVFSSMVGNIIGGSLPMMLFDTGIFTVAWSQRVTLLISTVASLVAVIPLQRIQEVSVENTSDFKVFVENITSRENWAIMTRFIIASGLVGFGAGLFVPFSNVYFENQFSLPSDKIGIIMSMGQATTIFAVMMGPYVANKIGRVKTVFILQGLSIPFMVMLGDTKFLWLAIIAFLIRQAIMNASGPITSTIMMEEVPEKLKGLTNSLNQTVVQIGWAVCGRLSGKIIENYGYEWIFYLAGALYGTSAIYYYFTFRKLDQPTEDVLPQAKVA
ncbi:MFS transporter [Alkaliphilus hydrothermalis]|uniref:MFS family permease n=1 Tax=Alkaliphilus hydrothermalis TaxID=1482730 RepID=A0ABS2NQM4_9FIRM|nr:MFS transporter [Alkaliphilus hydrothermalis]MBM7615247.1 MFS family permease [Alkaliphilus hydrothermalis]